MTRFRTDKSLEHAERIMLVSVMLPENYSGANEIRERTFQAACLEAAELVRATGGELIAHETAKREKAHTALFVGTGKAEELANREFSKRISTLLGQNIIASENNIDDTDLYKIDTTPGFMTIEHTVLNKIRSVEDFNKALENMVLDTHSLDNERSAKRIGIIINCGEKTQGFIDQTFDVLKKKYGTPYELFLHIQNYHDEEYVDIIVSGMKIPYDDIKNTYNKYKKQMESIDMNQDRFFKHSFDTSAANTLDMNSKVKRFTETDTRKLAASRSNFFSKMGKKSEPTGKDKEVSDEL